MGNFQWEHRGEPTVHQNEIGEHFIGGVTLDREVRKEHFKRKSMEREVNKL